MININNCFLFGEKIMKIIKAILFLVPFLINLNILSAAEVEESPFDAATSISKQFFHGEIKSTEITDLEAFVKDMENNANATGEGYILNNINNLALKKALKVTHGVKNDKSFMTLEIINETVLEKSLENTSRILEASKIEEEDHEQ